MKYKYIYYFIGEKALLILPYSNNSENELSDTTTYII